MIKIEKIVLYVLIALTETVIVIKCLKEIIILSLTMLRI